MTDAALRRSPTLEELQRLHERFEQERGFDFARNGSGSSPGSDTDDFLHRVEYATLAMAGEVGELANFVKKARRATWLGGDSQPGLEGARTEITDVLAYLLKLANLLDLDFTGEYLEKMSVNRLRFPAGGATGLVAPVVTVAGPPGSGKSSVVRVLSEQFEVHEERYEENPYLAALFDRDRRATFDAYSSQLWFLRDASDFLQERGPGTAIVLDQDPAAAVRVYGRHFMDESCLSRAEYHRLLIDLSEIEARIARWPGQRSLVLLDADSATLERRVIQRNPSMRLSRRVLEDLRRGFREFGHRVKPALCIATDDLSVEEVAVRVGGLLPGKASA
jgi:deoxyadenosine/deoxycytidine kinase/NTP pyrophosphatase (non-canonical NTP hydrolase)